MAISYINNGELGSSVRAKLNSVIDEINSMSDLVNIVANKGVGLEANIPVFGTVSEGDIYVTTDTFKIYTAEVLDWDAGVPLASSQFVTDTVNASWLLYQFDGTTLNQLFCRTQDTGTAVVFSTEKIYNTATTPATGNISFDQTNAKLGVVQKMYHNDTVAPTFSGVTDIQKITANPYVPNVLNILLFEWTENNRVEYHVMQEG